KAEASDAPAADHIVRRAEKFSAALDADTAQNRAEAPQAVKAPETAQPQPQLTSVPTVQAPAATAPVSAANAALSSKPVPLDGVAIEIAARAGEGKKSFEIRLDPPELGRIEVRLDVDKSGQVVSHITADRGDTLDLLRRDASNLERALQDAGLKTGGNNLQFSLRDQGFAGKQQDAGNETARLIVNDTSTPVPTPRDYRAYGSRSGGVDIRV
ncbi:MAG: flagellar hook-length control protein FliK, partial [Pseudolabrys sp.]|nr:flagellar hook-length control protein FliK [Pseudolabrys sp.]